MATQTHCRGVPRIDVSIEPTAALEALLARHGANDHPTWQGLLGNVRGELAERRAVRLLRAMCEVQHVYRTSARLDAITAADVVAVLREGSAIYIQVKASRRIRSAKSSPGAKRAKRMGNPFVFLPESVPDHEATHRLRIALGLRVSEAAQGATYIRHRARCDKNDLQSCERVGGA